ncbi:S8 family peptidase [Evansella cellulosilytica]|uniref:Peptidase S8 and S53 subtilisin kexin sedolisin n=1 Tax=Evansella cellulosilytica (strain ATCC 21833 / DSM 2522 / FERM P-1141 / JCM 9156 / N-4) TaxID=649639 RepID=E6TVJ2_EVAC2|nr:S8 family peptidase [Evansella cellulosilytica]ADU31009.1 peptidase S8 and S53 subtilisin kexin sedolisin [Evansella cellulosilytica DSM 2522]
MAPLQQLVVCFKPRTKRSSCLKMHKEMKAKLVKEMKEIGMHVVRVPNNEASSCLTKYASSPSVRFVEEDQFIQVEPISTSSDLASINNNTSTTTNDPLLQKQWGLENVNAQEAWELANVSPISSTIAILDTGVSRHHEDLRGKVIHQAIFSNSSTVDDVHGHGTHVAGIAAAITNNGNGIAGISYNSAGIMNIKVMGDTGGGTMSNVAEGIIYATNQGADVINLSLGSTMISETLRSAVNYAHNNGVLLVGAAGNNATNMEHYPAAYNQVLAVAATNETNELTSFSNYGTWVEIAAPGQEIVSTYINEESGNSLSEYSAASGTSQAAPFISGLAALIKSTTPTLNNREMRVILQRAANQSVSGGPIRFGRIDARRAIQLALNIANNNPQQRTNIPGLWLNL